MASLVPKATQLYSAQSNFNKSWPIFFSEAFLQLIMLGLLHTLNLPVTQIQSRPLRLVCFPPVQSIIYIINVKAPNPKCLFIKSNYFPSLIFQHHFDKIFIHQLAFLQSLLSSPFDKSWHAGNGKMLIKNLVKPSNLFNWVSFAVLKTLF